MSKIFFTADLHFGHNSMVKKFDKRPFKNAKEMDKALIEKWNAKVRNDDTVYVLGDMFCKCREARIAQIMTSLNGEIILIRGNHDKWASKPENRKYLKALYYYDDINVHLHDGTIKRCILSHYYMPFYNGHNNGVIHLHGHSHNTVEAELERQISSYMNEHGFTNEIYNVGCMHYNYEPVTLDEILTINSSQSNIHLDNQDYQI